MQYANIFFILHFGVALFHNIRQRRLLPTPPTKPFTNNPLAIKTLWFPLLWHILEYTVELLFTTINITKPWSAMHHALTVLLAICAFCEPHMGTSALYIFPWWLHAIAVSSNPNKKRMFGRTVFYLLTGYNVLLLSFSVYMVRFGFREKWRRYTPAVPLIGVGLFLCNYQRYCYEMRGGLCLWRKLGMSGHFIHVTGLYGFIAVGLLIAGHAAWHRWHVIRKHA